MASLIHFNSINYDKKRKVIVNRYPLTLDNNERLDSNIKSSYDPEIISLDLKDHITDNSLFLAYKTLSEKQQKVLSLSYVRNLNDKEIAIIIGGSQQNVSKHRLKALSKLRDCMLRERKG